MNDDEEAAWIFVILMLLPLTMIVGLWISAFFIWQTAAQMTP